VTLFRAALFLMFWRRRQAPAFWTSANTALTMTAPAERQKQSGPSNRHWPLELNSGRFGEVDSENQLHSWFWERSSENRRGYWTSIRWFWLAKRAIATQSFAWAGALCAPPHTNDLRGGVLRAPPLAQKNVWDFCNFETVYRFM